MKKAALNMTLVLLYALLLTWLSLMPGSDYETWFSHADKLLHVGAYAVFALICAPLWWRSGGSLRATLSILVLVCLFSGAIELGQALVPNREPSWLDMLANSMGLIIGWQVSNGIKKARKLQAFFTD